MVHMEKEGAGPAPTEKRALTSDRALIPCHRQEIPPSLGGS